MVCSAEGGTGVPPVRGNDSGTGVSPVRGNGSPKAHGRDARATFRYGAYLPHWTLATGGIYAVTFRLGDSLPRQVLERLLADREALIADATSTVGFLTPDESRRLARLHAEHIESYLNAGSGSCWMRRDDIARIVADSLCHFDGERYRLHAWCIMPNHVHALVEPVEGHRLEDAVQAWKSFSAKMANRQLGRSGEFWQPEYYDHLIRDEADYAHACRYIEQNPIQARLSGWRWISGKDRGNDSGTGVPPVRGNEVQSTHAHGRDARATA